VLRAHGIRGEVIVRLTTDRDERVAPGSVLTAPRGPLTVIESRSHKGDWIVAFEGVVDRNGADALRGDPLSAPPINDPDVVWIHDLIGARVVDASGVDRGQVLSVEDNPVADLLVLDDGHVVPMTFVTAVEGGVISVEVPDGLFDL